MKLEWTQDDDEFGPWFSVGNHAVYRICNGDTPWWCPDLEVKILDRGAGNEGKPFFGRGRAIAYFDLLGTAKRFCQLVEDGAFDVEED